MELAESACRLRATWLEAQGVAAAQSVEQRGEAVRCTGEVGFEEWSAGESAVFSELARTARTNQRRVDVGGDVALLNEAGDDDVGPQDCLACLSGCGMPFATVGGAVGEPDLYVAAVGDGGAQRLLRGVDDVLREQRGSVLVEHVRGLADGVLD